MVRVGLDCTVALDNTVLDVSIVGNVYIIKNNGILDCTIAADKGLTEDDRVLNSTVND